MSTSTISGPLHYCKCGHGEHVHAAWYFEWLDSGIDTSEKDQVTP